MALHAGLAAAPALAAVAVVHCAGARMRALHAALPRRQRGEWFPDAAAMAARAGRLLDAGDIALVKGSNGSRVSLVVDAIKKMGEARPPETPGRKPSRLGAPMFYFLAELSQNLGVFNLFRYITFRAGGAFFTALVFGFLFGRPLIDMLRLRQGRGQPIRSDGPESHILTKAGTPTMGGLLILSARVLLDAALGALGQRLRLAGAVRHRRLRADRLRRRLRQGDEADPRRRLGPGAARRRVSRIALIAGAWAMWLHPAELTGQLAFPVFKTFLLDLGWLFLPFAMLVIVGAANAVNLTDGLDGLAIMPVMIAAGSLGVIAYVVGRVDFTEYLDVHFVPGTGEITIFVAALIGGGLGFLWYNAPPAAVFMGDTGSARARRRARRDRGGDQARDRARDRRRALRGRGAVSVIIQVAYYKRTKKRVFLMAPIHHHFEKKGWAEPQIVIRFWIVSLILALIGLATLKLR